MVEPRHAQLHITWPECPVVENRLWPAARFVFDTTGYGWVSPWGGPHSSVTIGCPPSAQDDEVPPVPPGQEVETTWGRLKGLYR